MSPAVRTNARRNDGTAAIHDPILSLLQIASFWSDERVPARSEEETFALLLASFWRGEFEGVTVNTVGRKITRRNVLTALNSQREMLTTPLILLPGARAPEPIYGLDGSVTLPLMLQLILPLDASMWTDEQIIEASRVLAEDAHRAVTRRTTDAAYSYDHRVWPAIFEIALKRADFLRWVAGTGERKPTFWGSSTAAVEARKKSAEEQKKARFDFAFKWLSENVTPRRKRRETIEDCMRATGVPFRIVVKAWDALPSQQKRPRGRPPHDPKMARE